MTKRRDAVKAMMTPIAIPDPNLEERRPRPSGAAGSVKSMALSLKSLSAQADEAQALRSQLESGEQVVELDPDLVDGSIIRDRIEDSSGQEFEEFKRGLMEAGQQVPVLVRPHANQPGRYQLAYGHRRVAALRALGRPVKAIVRNLSDEQLIVAQGKENNDRRDLSFIERALFAARLEDHGFSRAALVSALSVQKGNLSTMISVARSLPETLILAIGPAPKVGRPRWEHLARLVAKPGSDWLDAITAQNFASVDSDARFERVLQSLSRPSRPVAQEWLDNEAGRRIARIERAAKSTRVTIDHRVAPDFARYLADQLPEIYAAFRRGGGA